MHARTCFRLRGRAESIVTSRRRRRPSEQVVRTDRSHDPSRADSDRRLTTSRGLASLAVSTRLACALLPAPSASHPSLMHYPPETCERLFFLLAWDSQKPPKKAFAIIAFCLLSITLKMCSRRDSNYRRIVIFKQFSQILLCCILLHITWVEKTYDYSAIFFFSLLI